VAFLGNVKMDGATLTPDALTALTGAVGAQVLAAKQAAIAARGRAGQAGNEPVLARRQGPAIGPPKVPAGVRIKGCDRVNKPFQSPDKIRTPVWFQQVIGCHPRGHTGP
jgi:hypothetical protein